MDEGQAVQRQRATLVVRIVAACGIVALLYFLVRGTLLQRQFKYNVCVDFRGSSYCSTASGATSAEAIRSGQEIDCTQLASGRDANMACLDVPPASVQQIAPQAGSR
jgi:hypothetical protein